MNKNMLSLLVVAGLLIGAVGCTENSRARSFGGTMSENLPRGQKLVTATWKESHLWYLTRPMASNETAVTSTFHEQSSWGMLQGTVIFIESK